MTVLDLIKPNPAAPQIAPAADIVWLNTVAVAEHTGFSVSWLEKARCEGKGPPYSKPHAAVRYLKSDVDNWLLSHKREPANVAA